MQKKVNQVEEKAASLLVSSQQTKQERDELKRKLLKAESIEQYTPASRLPMSSLSPSPPTVVTTSSSENVCLLKALFSSQIFLRFLSVEGVRRGWLGLCFIVKSLPPLPPPPPPPPPLLLPPQINCYSCNYVIVMFAMPIAVVVKLL